MRVCPYCSSENADTALFCISCGSSLKNSKTRIIPVRQIVKQSEKQEIEEEDELFDDPEISLAEADEAAEFELQMRRYRLEQGSAGRKGKNRRGRKEDKKIMLIGVISILAVLIGGIVAFNLLSGAFAGNHKRTTTARLSDDMIKALTREKEAEVDLQTPETADPSEQQEVRPTEEAPKKTVSASLVSAADLDNTGYERVDIISAEATSVIDQEGFDNTPIRAVDGNESTSWQEGVDGPGIGETIEYVFDRTYSVHSMTFKLGNWASERYFWMNNRPETITIWLDDVGFEVTFPDGMEEFGLLFDEDIQVSEVQFEINSVYQGTTYDDTCISDIGIYGA